MAKPPTSNRPAANEPRPPFEEQEPQKYPGTEAEMTPAADHGEKTYTGTGRLLGKATLITGADSGIGRAVALAFAREGADVLIAYLEEDADARATSELVEQAGRRAVSIRGDIRDEAHCRHLVERAFEAFGRLDVLVNNAAYQMAQERLEDITAEQFDRTFRTNVYGTFFLSKAAVPRMTRGSSIINSVSIQAYDQSPQLLDYASTKCALVGMTKAMARMLAERGIRVNAVAPGPVWTPLIPATMPEDHVKQFGGSSLFGRPAQPAELAPLYVLLASEQASYLTGEVFSATGGRSPY